MQPRSATSKKSGTKPTTRSGSAPMRDRLIKSVLPVGLGLLALAGASHRATAGGATTVKAAVSKGVLTVTGTKYADSISVRLRFGDPNMMEIDVASDGTADYSFDRAKFTKVVIEGRDGDDTLLIQPFSTVPTDAEQITLDG